MMILKIRFYCGLAFMICLSLAMTNVKAEDSAEEVYGAQTEQELVFVAALNEYRTTRGLNPVGVCGELSSDCRQWSTRMRQKGQLSHDPMGGTEICAQIASECGMSALRVWQKSPAHNAILLSSRIDAIGIGSDNTWWTMRGRQKNGERAVSRTTEFRTTDARTEVSDNAIDDAVGRRAPMGVSLSSIQRTTVPTGNVRTVPNFRYRAR